MAVKVLSIDFFFLSNPLSCSLTHEKEITPIKETFAEGRKPDLV